MGIGLIFSLSRNFRADLRLINCAKMQKKTPLFDEIMLESIDVTVTMQFIAVEHCILLSKPQLMQGKVMYKII